jgi:hypothetical protein
LENQLDGISFLDAGSKKIFIESSLAGKFSFFGKKFSLKFALPEKYVSESRKFSAGEFFVRKIYCSDSTSSSYARKGVNYGSRTLLGQIEVPYILRILKLKIYQGYLPPI